MELNLKWIIIGLVFVTLMVAFGNNPVENRRKERAEAMKDKDPLMESIREYNEKNTGGTPMGGNSSFSGGGYDSYGGGYDNEFGGSSASQPAPQMPSYMYPQGSQQTGAAPAKPPTPANSYYPPPP